MGAGLGPVQRRPQAPGRASAGSGAPLSNQGLLNAAHLIDERFKITRVNPNAAPDAHGRKQPGRAEPVRHRLRHREAVGRVLDGQESV